MKFQTDLHAARGLGSAKAGLHHWLAQRMTAIALIPLGVWFSYVFIVLLTAPYEYAQKLFASPWTVTLSIFLILVMFYHGYLGMKVIWEDYIHQPIVKWLFILGTKIMSLFMSILAIVSILRIFLS